jgi:hypothetical protein
MNVLLEFAFDAYLNNFTNNLFGCRLLSSRRTTVTASPWQVAAEKKKQEALQAILEAPKPEHPEQLDAPAKMDQDINEDLPEVTAQNSGSILKKLKARRLAAARGTVPGKQKKRNPLAGANQFHKKKKKRSNK